MPFARSILFAGLAFATLISVHLSPQTVFFSEWYCALGLVLAWASASWFKEEGSLRLGLPVLAVGLLLVVCLARLPLSSGLGYPLYLVLFLVAYAMGQRFRFEGGEGWIAGGLLLCALLQSFAGLAQLVGWRFGGLVMQKLYLQAFGNIAQANHYTDLIFLGLASLCYLRARQKLQGVVFGGLAVWLCLAAAASASRGAWLYTAAFAVLGCWGLLRRGTEAETREAAKSLLLVSGFSVLAQVLVTYGELLSAFGVTSSLARAADAGSNGQRLFDWQAAWLGIQAKPWWGEGPGAFYKVSIDAMFKTPPAGFSKFAEHAHNLPLNLAAEFGVPVALIALGGFVVWYLRHLWRTPAVWSLWVLACVAVTGLHSMVEYPLWYAYFLVPMGLVLGVLDAGDETLPELRMPAWFGRISSVLGLLVLAWIIADWVALRSSYENLSDAEPQAPLEETVSVMRVLEWIGPLSVFSAHAEGLRIQAWRPENGGIESVVSRCDRTWPYKPAWFMMMRCGEAYAISDESARLDRLAKALCDGFPKHHKPLQEWAENFDAKGLASLKITGRACLVEP